MALCSVLLPATSKSPTDKFFMHPLKCRKCLHFQEDLSLSNSLRQVLVLHLPGIFLLIIILPIIQISLLTGIVCNHDCPAQWTKLPEHFSFFFFLAAPSVLRDLSTLTRDQTPAHGSESTNRVLTTGPLQNSLDQAS